MAAKPPFKDVDGILDGLKTSTEKLWTFVQWVAELVVQRQWSKLLLLLDAVLLFGFNPHAGFGRELLPEWVGVGTEGYAFWFWVLFAGLFLGAIAVVVIEGIIERGKRAGALGEMADRKAIKGLRSFEMEDAEIFARLERGDFVQECLLAIARQEFRLGVVAGEAGAGKTSVLQAGLMPILTLETLPGNLGKRLGVYAKFTEREPLETIRRALVAGIEALEREDVADKSLREMFEVAVLAADRPLVLILDQFEQFFVHFPRREAREPFVQAVAEWYRDPQPVAVGLLIGIREDWLGRLLELQQALGWVWGPQDMFSLQKFEPVEAARVLQTIAETEELRCDRRFLGSLTEDELARREDGLISPADVQVLAWTVARSKSPEMRAFDRDAFRKLGGVEGLMVRFVKGTLETRVTKAQREAAIKVLLALTDLERGTRAGTRSLGEIGETLQGALSTEAIREAAEWLGRGDVRLVTVTDYDGARGYELAHERLIPALRRVAGQELSEADKANQLLDRRTNEWLGNDRDRRYLLGWKELREIRTQQPYLVWGSNERHKRRLIQLSQRRLNVWKGVAGFVAVAIGGGVGWYVSPYGQIQQVRWDLERTSISSDDRHTLGALELLAQGHLLDDMTVIIGERFESDYWQAEALRIMSEVYEDLGDLNTSAAVLEKAHAIIREIPEDEDSDDSKFALLSDISTAYKLSSKSEINIQGLEAVRKTARTIKSYKRRYDLLLQIAIIYQQAGQAGRSTEVLGEARKSAEQVGWNSGKASALIAIAKVYANLEKPTVAIEILKDAQNAANRIGNDISTSQILIDIAVAYGRLGRIDIANRILENPRATAFNDNNVYSKLSLLIDIARAHQELGQLDLTINTLEVAQTVVKEAEVDHLISSLLQRVAIAYGEIGRLDVVINGLEKLQSTADTLTSDLYRFEVLNAIYKSYKGLEMPEMAIIKILDISRATADEITSEYSRSRAYEKLALGYGELGDLSTAEELLDRNKALIDSFEHEYHKPEYLYRLAETHVKLLKNTTNKETLRQREQKVMVQASIIADRRKNFSMMTALAKRYAELQEWAVAHRLVKHCPPNEKVEALAKILLEWEKQHAWVVRLARDRVTASLFTEHLERVGQVNFK